MSAVNVTIEETIEQVTVAVTETLETVTVSVTAGVGATGAAATLAVGTTTTGEAGTDASVTETGTSQNKTFNFVIPRGAVGAAATVAVGTTTTGETGSDASVTETGDAQNKTFDFLIPRGATGAAATVAVGTTTTGETGTDASVTETGTAQNKTFDFLIPRGAVGAAATVAVGTTTTGEAGTDASVTETGDAQNKTFNFVIPRGADGGGGGGGGGKFVDGTNPDDAVYLAGRVGIGVALPVSRQHIQGNDAAVVVQRVQGAAGQTANLAEWRNAGGKTLVEVSAEGVLTFSANNDLTRPTASIYVAADVANATTNALYIAGTGGRIFLGSPEKSVNLDLRNVSSVNSAPAYNTGNFSLGATGNSHGIGRIGNDVAIWTSATNGRLLHYTNPDTFGPRTVLRYVVLPGGNFGIGVEEPTEKLHVDGKIKASSINFTGLPTSAAGLETGDVWNDNGTLKIV